MCAYIHVGFVRNVGKVFFQPLHLGVGESVLVAAVAFDARRLLALAFHVYIYDVVEEDPVVASYVHGVAVRTPYPAVEPGGTEIHFFADYGSIVVVVSGDCVCPERQFLVYHELAGIGLVEVEFIPVEFVGEVAEVHHIDRPLGFRGFLSDERHHLLFEPGNIVPAGIVAQMYVREKEHSVIVLVFAHQSEVVSFHLVGGGFQHGPEARSQAVGRFGHRT